MGSPKVKLYALSTCSHCRAVKRLLQSLNADFDAVDVDQLDKIDRKAVLEQVKQVNEKVSFPTTVIGEQIIVGNKEELIRSALEKEATCS